MKKWEHKTRGGEIVAATLRAGNFKITVHRHIHWSPDMWLVSCYGLFDNKELASKDLEQAKCQAAALVQVALEAALKVIISE